MKTCPQCQVSVKPGNATCGNSYCQEAEYHDNEARAKGLKNDGRPRKGWLLCGVEGCKTPTRVDGDYLCFGHRYPRRAL